MDAGRGSNVFPMPQIPELLFPPPPPPLSSSYSLSASTSRHVPTITSFPILVLTVLGILTTSVLLLAYYVFVIRCCLKWHRGSSTSDAAGHRRRQRATSSSSTTTSSLPASGATPAEARGLDDAIIQALPAFRYRKAVKNASADSAAAAPTSECAVCLGEFEDEEKVRMLPACLHVFHARCIDTWLQGNANCPLCRAAITSHCLLPPLDLDQPPRPEPGEVVIQVVPTTGTEEDEQAMRAQQQQQASTAMASYESAGDTNTTDQQVSSDKRKSNNAWRDIDISSKADECVTDRDVLPLRRSFSTGEMAGGEVHLQIQSILQRNTHFHGDDGDGSSNSSSA